MGETNLCERTRDESKWPARSARRDAKSKLAQVLSHLIQHSGRARARQFASSSSGAPSTDTFRLSPLLADGLVTVAPLLERLGHVTALVDTEPEAVALARLRAAETIGRPLGSDAFVTRLEGLVQRHLRRQKAGRKAKTPTDAGDLFAGMDDGPKRPGNM